MWLMIFSTWGNRPSWEASQGGATGTSRKNTKAPKLIANSVMANRRKRLRSRIQKMYPRVSG